MSSRCSSSSCLNGNCEGCKNGVKFCNDPRCFPDCPDCSDETSSSSVNRRDGLDWTLISIIGGLAILLLIILLYMGWTSAPNCKPNEKKTLVYTRQARQVRPQYTQQYQPPQVKLTTTNLKSARVPTARVPTARVSTVRVPTSSTQLDFEQLSTSSNLVGDIDASLNVPDIGGIPSLNDISISESITTLPKIPPVSLTSPANVSVASAQTLSVPSFQDLSTQGEIQGF